MQPQACMNILHVHTDDRAWMWRRLRSSIRGMTVLLVLSLLMHRGPSLPGSTGSETTATARSVAVDSAPSETRIAVASGTDRQLNPVAPVGWRRTNRGWEHVSTWPTAGTTMLSTGTSDSINQLILSQRASESWWLQTTLAHLRQIPPLIFCVMQIAAIAVIAASAKKCKGFA